MGVRVSAEGTWPGQATAVGRILLDIKLSPEDPLPVWVDDGMLHLGSFYLPCRWDPDEVVAVELPLDASFAEVISLPLRFTEEQIAQSGLANAVRDATERRDRLVRRACSILEPFGITPPELVELLDQYLHRRLVAAAPESPRGADGTSEGARESDG